MKPISNNLEQKIRQMQPLIVLGMHRSGTSLVVHLLDDLGIFMGRDLSRDAESIFFQKINRRIYHSVGANWGYIVPLIQAMYSPQFVEQKTAHILRELFPERHSPYRGVGISDFFGSQLWEAINQEMPVTWGWKDPRTTITFPIWLRIFPQARLLHILRNGIDVAISTHRRTERQKRKLWKRIIRLDYAPITHDFEYCFHLWEDHVTYVFNQKDQIPPDHYLEMRYEDLLASPQDWIRQVADFTGYVVSDELISSASKQVNRSRLNNANFAADYLDQIPKLASSPLMQQLGYHYEMAWPNSDSI